MRALFVILLAMLQGCVGVSVIHDSIIHYSPEESTKRNRIYSNVRAEPNAPNIMTKEEVLHRRGNPDKIWHEGNLEVWNYDPGISWAAVVVFVIVPIPLGIPTGPNGDRFIFDGDTLVAEEIHKNRGSGPVCGLFVVGTDNAAGMGFDCSTER